MKKKQLIAMLLASTMLFGSTLTTFAADLSEEGDTTTMNSTAGFTATSNNLGGLVVSVPATMTLSYADDKYSVTDNISAYGALANALMLQITAPASTEFVNQEIVSANTLTGAIAFGDENRQAFWSAEELWSGKEDSNTIKGVDVSCSIDDITGIQVGEYSSVISFGIEIIKDASKAVISNTATGIKILDDTYTWDISLWSTGSAGTIDNTTALESAIASGLTTVVMPSHAAVGTYDPNFKISSKMVGATTFVINPDIEGITQQSFADGTSTITTVYCPEVSYIKACSFITGKLNNMTDFYYVGTADSLINALTCEDSLYNGNYGSKQTKNQCLYNATIHVLDTNNNWTDFDTTGFLATYDI